MSNPGMEKDQDMINRTFDSWSLGNLQGQDATMPTSPVPRLPCYGRCIKDRYTPAGHSPEDLYSLVCLRGCRVACATVLMERSRGYPVNVLSIHLSMGSRGPNAGRQAYTASAFMC